MSNISRVLKLSIFLLLEADDEIKLWFVIQQDGWWDEILYKNILLDKMLIYSPFNMLPTSSSTLRSFNMAACHNSVNQSSKMTKFVKYRRCDT